MKLLIGTNNNGKLTEIQDILKILGVELLSPKDIGLEIDVSEDGLTYAENASKKALSFAKASGLITLADDTGLEVDALNGKPGLHSKRFGPEPSTDASRRAHLIQLLNGIPRPWIARFRATVAIACPEGSVEIIEGICEGEIVPDEQGNGGFGYDPIFFIPEAGQTMAELNLDEKNHLSHRGRAVQFALPVLKRLLRLER